MAGGDHGLYTRRCQVEDRWLSFRGRIEIFISILPEDLKVFRYTHEEKLTLPKFGIALKSLSAYSQYLDTVVLLPVGSFYICFCNWKVRSEIAQEWWERHSMPERERADTYSIL